MRSGQGPDLKPFHDKTPHDVRDRQEPQEAGPGRPYAPPRIEKRRPVSRATLFTGSGPESGGVISN